MTISYQPLSVTIVRPSRVVQLLRICDFEYFLSFLHGLIGMLAAQPTYVVRDDGREEDRSFLALFLQSQRWFELAELTHITCTEILLRSLTPLTMTTEQMMCGTHGQR